MANNGVPDKLYFKIGEASKIVGVPAYVLRFWEGEFKQINPKRTESGQRLYRRQDVILVLQIKKLLYNRRFTIEGARQHLKQKSNLNNERKLTQEPELTDISDIRNELIHIRDLLDNYRG